MTEQMHELRDLAVQAAERAGQFLLLERPKALAVTATKSSPTDVVTEMDQRTERLIAELIRQHRSGDGILGEEGAYEAGTSDVRWIVDPIDGTVNYLYDLPGWAVSVAAEMHGEVVVGVVAIPSFGEIYTAIRGEGAFRDGEPITCNAAPPIEYALVATGFGYATERRAKQAAVIAALLPRVRDIRRYGSCAADLCAVASGRVDAYYEQGPKYWDLAAGTLIAREAGARVEGLKGAPPSEQMAIAAPPGLFEPLHDFLLAHA